MSNAPCPRSRWLLAIGAITQLLAGLPAVAEDAGTLYDTPFDIAAGQRYFERQCSRCHGFDARGNDETGAPDLTGRLNRAASDAGIFNVIREGVPGTAMLPVDASVSNTQIWRLVSYINSIRFDPEAIQPDGDAESGAALFRGKGDCDSCHMVNGRGGRLGPDLSWTGETRHPDEIMDALVRPDAEVAPRWWTLRVTDLDGVTRSGFRMGEDSFSVRIMDDDSNLWSFAKEEIQSLERIETSTMPGYEQVMSESELDDLVAYLFSLRREEN